VEDRAYLTVKTEVLTPGESGTNSLTYSGTLRAGKSTQVGFLRSGRIVGLYADDGSRVTEGQLLGVLDTRSLEARRGELSAQLAEARAASEEVEAGPRRYERQAAIDQVKQVESQLSLVRTKLERRRTLFQEGAVPKEQVDELVSQEQNLANQLRAAQNRVRDLDAGAKPETREVARSRIGQVQANLDSLQVQIADSELRAPYSGTVSQRLLDEGAIVSTGQPVFEIMTAGRLEATLNLPPERARELKPGQELNVSSEGESYKALVKEVLPQADTATGTQIVLLSVPAAPGLVAGGLVVFQVDTEQPGEGYWVPATALLPGERGLFMLYTVIPVEDRTGLFEVKKQAVEIMRTTGERAFVRGTMTGRPEVIVEGVQRVVPGQKVRKS
jgi:multidrug resistance efflux pump